MARDEDAVPGAKKAKGASSHRIDPTSCVDRFIAWAFRRIFKRDYGNLFWTALLSLPSCLSGVGGGNAARIFAVSSMSCCASCRLLRRWRALGFLRKGPIPFVIGRSTAVCPGAELQPIGQTTAQLSYWARTCESVSVLPFARSTTRRPPQFIAGSPTCRDSPGIRTSYFTCPVIMA